MEQTVVKALEGFEEVFEVLSAKKANLEAEKEVAINEAIAEINARFAEKAEQIEKILVAVPTTTETIFIDDGVNSENVEQTNIEQTSY